MRTGYLLIVLLFLCGSVTAQKQHEIDSLKSLLKTNIHDTTRVTTLVVLGWKLKYTNPDTAIILGKQALEISEEIGYTRGRAHAYGRLGVYFWLKGDYPTSLSNHFKALKLQKQLNDKYAMAATLGNIGIVYRNQGETAIALEYYFKVLKIYRELGNKKGTAAVLGNIGIVYFNQGDYPKALENYSEALELGKELGDKNRIAIQLGNIGLIYHGQGKTTKALEYYLEALKLRRELGAKHLISTMLGNIGSLYTQTGQFEAAETYLDNAITMSDSIGILAHQKDHHTYLTKLHDTLGQLAVGKGQWKEAALRYQLALQHNRGYGTAKDSLFNEEKSKDIGRLEQKHETEMVELQRNQEEEEAQRVASQARSRRYNLQYSGILIMLVLVFAGVFMLGRFKIPTKLAEGMIFFAFLLFFEFTLVLLDPYIESYSGGEPAYKLLFNAVLAGLIFPLHSLFETKLKGRLVKQ